MFQFTEDCLIGIKEIDDEHRQLFQLINEAVELTESGSDLCSVGKNLVQKLKVYAETHFAHEEAYMKQIGDMELPRQQQEHAQFVEKIESYRSMEWTKEQSPQMVNELLSFMAKWLYHHILGSDIMIGKLPKDEKKEDVFVFSEKYKTGIPLIDQEHEHLFEIVKKTKDVIAAQFLHDKYDEIVDILKELREYTMMHFRDEENYMESIGYEGLELQSIAHTAFVERLNQINLEEMDDNQKEYLDEILQFLLGWLTNHILKMDKKIPVCTALES